MEAGIGDQERRLRAVAERIAGVRAVRDALASEDGSLVRSVGLAKGRLERQPEVLSAIELLQNRMHERAVGKFEALLSAILSDVFPEREDRVVIDVAVKRGQTEIAFMVTNGENTESALNGRGGSVANILSVGLRFITLSRSGLRPFIVLDEADCWLKPDRVPAFSRVVHDLSEKIGVQVLMISHHDADLFEGAPRVVHLLRAEDGSRIVDAQPSRDPWNDGKPGIRSIHLENVMAHEDTKIPLDPGVTVLVGDNDIGKSAVVMGLRALLYGEGAQYMIRHGADTASVALDLGPEGVLSWTRARKGAKKTRYALVRDGEIVHETEESKLPEWIPDLGFGKAGTLDVQIGHQKRPVFLLDEPGSKQAEVLSVGRESSHLAKMQQIYGDECREDRKTVREGEKRISAIRRKLDATGEVEDLARRAADLESVLKSMDSDASDIEEGCKLLERLRGLAGPAARKPVAAPPAAPELLETKAGEAHLAKLRAMSALPELEPVPPVSAMPDMEDTRELSRYVVRLRSGGGILAISPAGAPPEPPALEDCVASAALADRLRALSPLLALRVPEVPGAPEIGDLSEIRKTLSGLAEGAGGVARLQGEHDRVCAALGVVAEEYRNLVDDLGGECPLCGGVLSHECGDHDRQEMRA